MTLKDPRTHATYQIVDYASPQLREEAKRLERGTTSKVRIVRIGNRGNLWRVEGFPELTR